MLNEKNYFKGVYKRNFNRTCKHLRGHVTTTQKIEVDCEFGKRFGFTSDKFTTKSLLLKDKRVVYFYAIADYDEAIRNTIDLADNLLKDGFICKILDNVFHVNELEIIQIDNEILLPQLIDLRFLEKQGYKKTEVYIPTYKRFVDAWKKKPKQRKEDFLPFFLPFFIINIR